MWESRIRTYMTLDACMPKQLCIIMIAREKRKASFHETCFYFNLKSKQQQWCFSCSEYIFGGLSTQSYRWDRVTELNTSYTTWRLSNHQPCMWAHYKLHKKQDILKYDFWFGIWNAIKCCEYLRKNSSIFDIKNNDAFCYG